MAIVPLGKVTLYGTADQKSAVLDGLQRLGCMHLVNLRDETLRAAPKADISTEAHEALKYLRTCPVHRRPVKDTAEFNFNSVVEELLEIQQRTKQLREERDQLTRAIKDLTPWGDFRMPSPSEFDDLKLWFYTVPHYRLPAMAGLDFAWQVVARDHRFGYVVVLSTEQPDGVPGTRVQLDPQPLSDLTSRLEDLESELEDLHWWRVALTRWRELMSQTIAAADDQAARQHAERQTFDDPDVLALRGWVPRKRLKDVRDFADQQGLVLDVATPTADDRPPTLLDNPELMAGGEDAVTFYTTPAYGSWDPSLVVFISFSVFFAMIMADAGYALALGGLLLLFWKKLGRSMGGRRFRRLGVAIVVASVVYGALIGSYFGLEPAQDSPLVFLRVVDAADTALMMRISIVVGVVHLGLANLAVAWRDRRTLKTLASLGWVAILLGGLALGFTATNVIPGDWQMAGVGGLAGGAVAVLLFSSDRPLLSTKTGDFAGRLFDGFKALTGVSRAFGDVLSYLRLFALGLASAQLGATFNGLVYDASCCVGVGSLLAVFVVIFGHGLNLLLAIMSGVVHGLRLNCIEFFGWGLPEEGYPFRPFRLTAT